MAQVPRPPKQGNTATYAAKVAAGYTKILAGEIDADFDTIYNAWNNGADATNLKDGSITGAKLAADAVGPRELADGAVFTNHLQDRAVTTAKILDGNVTDAKIASVAWAKVTGAPAPPTIPTTLPPSGPATGDLTGSYPSPQLGTVQGGALKLNPRALVGAGDGTFMDVIANSSVGTAYDLNRATWQLKLDYTGDRFQIVRVPPQGGAASALVEVRGSDGKMVATLADNLVNAANIIDGSVGRAEIAPNAINSAPVFVANNPAFGLSTTGWTTVAALSITTRGGCVHLWASSNFAVLGMSTAASVYLRWLYDGAAIIQSVRLVLGAAYFPVPDLCWMHNPPAGAHTYTYQAAIDSGLAITSGGQSGGGYLAQEIG